MVILFFYPKSGEETSLIDFPSFSSSSQIISFSPLISHEAGK